jgi:pimeloyl-ACP methyl ester carboxylesterase
MNEPIVVLGGYGSSWRDYRDSIKALTQVTGRRVYVANITRATWAFANLTSYGFLLERAHQVVNRALRETNSERVVLIGHSAGGVVARAYLADNLTDLPQRKRLARAIHSYHGHRHVSHFYALGSPLRGTQPLPNNNLALRIIAWLDEHYPGAFYAPEVRYLSVTSKLIKGNANGKSWERLAYRYYRFLCGDGTVWGDGVVPNQLCFANGIPTLQITNVGHSPFAKYWYMSHVECVRAWWRYFDLGDAPSQMTNTAIA